VALPCGDTPYDGAGIGHKYAGARAAATLVVH
jgi:hypothetical protein